MSHLQTQGLLKVYYTQSWRKTGHVVSNMRKACVKSVKRLHRIPPFPKYIESFHNLGKMKKEFKEHSSEPEQLQDLGMGRSYNWE